MIEVEKISGIGEFTTRKHGEEGEDLVYEVPVIADAMAVSGGDGTEVAGGFGEVEGTGAERQGKAFLVLRPKTIEVRCDGKLSKVLREKYETVMESRYFGRGGVEIVPSGQLSEEELEDLVRLSYNMTQKITEEK